MVLLAVVVRDLFYNQPVRRKYMQSRYHSGSFCFYVVSMGLSSAASNKMVQCIKLTWSALWFVLQTGSPKKVLHAVIKCVHRIALVHSKVSFKLINIERCLLNTFLIEECMVVLYFFIGLITYFTLFVVRMSFFVQFLLPLPWHYWKGLLGLRSPLLFMNWT